MRWRLFHPCALGAVALGKLAAVIFRSSSTVGSFIRVLGSPFSLPVACRMGLPLFLVSDLRVIASFGRSWRVFRHGGHFLGAGGVLSPAGPYSSHGGRASRTSSQRSAIAVGVGTFDAADLPYFLTGFESCPRWRRVASGLPAGKLFQGIAPWSLLVARDFNVHGVGAVALVRHGRESALQSIRQRQLHLNRERISGVAGAADIGKSTGGIRFPSVQRQFPWRLRAAVCFRAAGTRAPRFKDSFGQSDPTVCYLRTWPGTHADWCGVLWGPLLCSPATEVGTRWPSCAGLVGRLLWRCFDVRSPELYARQGVPSRRCGMARSALLILMKLGAAWIRS